MAVFLGVGALLLVGGAALLWFGLQSRRRAAAIARTRTWSCAELNQAVAAGAAPGLVEVNGSAREVGAPLVTPFGGGPAVWHRIEVTHHYWAWETDAAGHRHRRKKRRPVLNKESAALFAVQDDSSRVMVEPRGARFDQPTLVVDEFADDLRDDWRVELGPLRFGGGGDSIGYQRREWSIAPGQPIYVLGAATDQAGMAVLRRPQRGELLISTRSESEVMASAGWQGVWLLVAGGVVAAGGVAAVMAGLAA